MQKYIDTFPYSDSLISIKRNMAHALEPPKNLSYKKINIFFCLDEKTLVGSLVTNI